MIRCIRETNKQIVEGWRNRTRWTKDLAVESIIGMFMIIGIFASIVGGTYFGIWMLMFFEIDPYTSIIGPFIFMVGFIVGIAGAFYIIMLHDTCESKFKENTDEVSKTKTS